MKVRDMNYIEDDIIAGIESYLPDSIQYCNELQSQSHNITTTKLLKEESIRINSNDKNNNNLNDVTKAPKTIPVSPRLSKGRLPKITEPDKISQIFIANEVPEFIEYNNLESISKMRNDGLELERIKTKAKYDEKLLFHFQDMKSGRDINDVRREVEEERMKEVQFNTKFVNPIPDFSKIPAKVRLNAAAIYREDALFRKQQIKDAETLKKYEEELRDPTEFLIWQKDMKNKDKETQSNLILQRKSDAKQSFIESQEAINKQKENNLLSADIQREKQSFLIKQNELNEELILLKNQVNVQIALDSRETKPKQAMEREFEIRSEKGRLLRESIEASLNEKLEKDKIDDEIKIDKIRQLKAENSVHKKNVVIFDPSEIVGEGFLDEMSYTEMKIRLDNEKLRIERNEYDRRLKILNEKDKRSKDLEDRSNTLIRIRQIKKDTNKAYNIKKKELEEKELKDKENHRQQSAIILDKELKLKKEIKQKEITDLITEDERNKRHRLYLGAAAGIIEETREKDLLLSKERIQSITQKKTKEEVLLKEKATDGDKLNRLSLLKKNKTSKETLEYNKNLELIEEKKRIVIKLREEVLRKRNMMLDGREQHEIINKKSAENNLYAHNISLNSVANAKKKGNDNNNNNNNDNISIDKNITRKMSSSSSAKSYK